MPYITLSGIGAGVARLFWEQEAVSSNPTSPTKFIWVSRSDCDWVGVSLIVTKIFYSVFNVLERINLSLHLYKDPFGAIFYAQNLSKLKIIFWTLNFLKSLVFYQSDFLRSIDSLRTLKQFPVGFYIP